ncbi:hypothetical protein [Floridanema aerugineum]|uniref:ATP synthase F0 subunit 8 n=1 Tax=Floridaenema aerugineum BLCC-F46 TaxID=3153654 RepID=A0ABV4WYR3_9CYAN
MLAYTPAIVLGIFLVLLLLEKLFPLRERINSLLGRLTINFNKWLIQKT